MKLAEALVLRKHLDAKVKQLEPLKLQGERGIFELQTKRVKVSDEIDEVSLQIPKVTLAQVTEEYDKYSKALRQLDTSIQATNWAADLAIPVDTSDLAI
jgi:hypothetical protein